LGQGVLGDGGDDLVLAAVVPVEGTSGNVGFAENVLH
jgi:hypothetical protein